MWFSNKISPAMSIAMKSNDNVLTIEVAALLCSWVPVSVSNSRQSHLQTIVKVNLARYWFILILIRKIEVQQGPR